MSNCVKCNEGTAIILVGTNGSFCKECFEKYFTHKFRASLGKNPIVRHGDLVAVAFSGGINSSAMLHVLLKSLSPTTFKKLKFHSGIIFVDETALLPAAEDNYESRLNEIETIMRESGLPYNIVKLEEVLSINEDVETGDNSDGERTQQLKDLFDSIKGFTSKEELLYRMRCKLLAYKAKELGYQHVFLGETSTRLAINIMSNIAQGQGAHLSLDTGFTDHGRYYGINLLRPLRDISAKEIAVYNTIHKVHNVFLPNFSTKLPANSSIQRLTEDFIVSLSTDFPSTETTVYRTSNKLEMAKSSKSNKDQCYDTQRTCYLCCGLLDTYISKDAATALQAIEFTENLSTGKFGCADNPDLPNQLDDSVTVKSSNFIAANGTDVRSARSSLCHSCRVLYKDGSKEDRTDNLFEQLLLPARKITEEEMSKQIEDLLLDS